MTQIGTSKIWTRRIEIYNYALAWSRLSDIDIKKQQQRFKNVHSYGDKYSLLLSYTDNIAVIEHYD